MATIETRLARLEIAKKVTQHESTAMQSGLCDMSTFWSGVDPMLTKCVPFWRSPMPNRG
jgi:hypothetical protein